jgi:hypothetical protein
MFERTEGAYDREAEYAISNCDSPHRILLAPIVRFSDPAAIIARSR